MAAGRSDCISDKRGYITNSSVWGEDKIHNVDYPRLLIYMSLVLRVGQTCLINKASEYSENNIHNN